MGRQISEPLIGPVLLHISDFSARRACFYLVFPQESDNLCRLRRTCAENAPFRAVRNCRSGKGVNMQRGSLIRRARSSHSEVWEFRWREPGPTGTRCHRRIVVGSTDQIADESAARQAVAALQIEINQSMKSIQPAISIGDLVKHFQQRELRTGFASRTFSTRNTNEGYLRKWIVPRWSEHPVDTLKAGEVELWLRSLPLARASCAKIRNLMSLLFNLGVRHGICDTNPIRLGVSASLTCTSPQEADLRPTGMTLK